MTFLLYSRTFELTFKKALLINSFTIHLLNELLICVCRNPNGNEKKKGGLKIQMVINAAQSVG